MPTLTAGGVRCQRLPVSHAFHSPLVEPMLDAFEGAVTRTRRQPPSVRIVSNLSGKLVGADEMQSPAYWRRHVREPVRFADGLRTLAQLKPDICVEIGPHPTLLTLAQSSFEALDDAPRLAASLRKGQDDDEQIARHAVGACTWPAPPSIGAPSGRRRRAAASICRVMRSSANRCWFAARPVFAASSGGRDTGHALLGVRLRSAQREVVQFEQTLRADSLPYFNDHRVQGHADPAGHRASSRPRLQRAGWRLGRLSSCAS